MPHAVNHAPMFGIFGKLPARSDFVRLGLPREFVDAWDDWLSGVMATTREQAGDAWLPAYLEAPVWRFALPGGMCGTGAVIGLIMPSVDRAGRYFPLTLAAVAERGAGLVINAAADAWLDRCEDAGLAALEKDAEPDDIRAMQGVPDLPSTGRSFLQSEWWTLGSPRVPPCRMTLGDLPDADDFAAMLGVPSASEQSMQALQTTDPPE